MLKNDEDSYVQLRAENDGVPRTGLTDTESKGWGPESDLYVRTKDKELREFEAWGTVEAMDTKGEIIRVGPVEERLEVMSRRGAGGAPIILDHTQHVVGATTRQSKAVYKDISGKEAPAIYLEGRIFKDYKLDDIVWENVLNGTLNAISIGGKNYRESQRCDSTGVCATILEDVEPTGWSITGNPINPLAKLTEIRKSFTEEGELLLEEMVRKPILDHYRKEGLDGRCGPCQEFVQEVRKGLERDRKELEGEGKEVEKGMSLEQESIDIANSILTSALDRYDEWYGPGAPTGEITVPNDTDNSSTVSMEAFKEVIKSEMEEMRKALPDIIAEEVKKALVLPQDTSKADDAGGEGTPKETGKSLIWPPEYQETVKSEMAAMKDEVMKSMAEQIKVMVGDAIKEVQKGTDEDEAKGTKTVETAPVASGEVRKSGTELDANGTAGTDDITEKFRVAWANKEELDRDIFGI